MSLALNFNQIQRTIIVNAQSAGVRSDLYLYLGQFVEDKISKNQLRVLFEQGTKALDDLGSVTPKPAGAEISFALADSIISAIKSVFPDYVAKAKKSFSTATSLMAQLQTKIQNSNYEAFEIRFTYDCYRTTDGKVMEIPVLSTITGYYTKSGYKVTS